MRNKELLIGAVALLAVAGFVLRYSVFFDAEGWLTKLSANADEGALVEAGQKRHDDPSSSPCLRYAKWDVIDDAKAQKVASEVASHGLDVAAFSAMAPVFAGWIDEGERQHHGGADRFDERVELLARDESMAGVILTLNQSKLRAAMKAKSGDAEARAAHEWGQLAPEKQKSLRALYETERAAFSGTGHVRVLHALAGAMTNERVQQLAADTAPAMRRGELDAAAVASRAAAITDAWQAPLNAEGFDGGVVIWSNGADRARGGEGPNADYVAEVWLDPDADPKSEAFQRRLAEEAAAAAAAAALDGGDNLNADAGIE